MGEIDVKSGKKVIKSTSDNLKDMSLFLYLPRLSPKREKGKLPLSAGGVFISMNQQGYILIWRKLLETSFYKNSYTLHLALHLLIKTNHQDNKIIFNGEEIEIKRGQVIVGRKTLSLETGIAEGTVYDKLKILEKCNFCNIKSNNKFSLITILNYESYQNGTTGQRRGNSDIPNSSVGKPVDNPKKQQHKQHQNSDEEYNKSNNESNSQPTASQQPANSQPTQTKNVKNDNNEKKVNKVEFSFEEIYLKYPNKVGKKEALRHFEASVKTNQDWQDIQTSLKNYLLSERVKKGFIQNASTWFNQWRDWIIAPVSEPKGLENIPEDFRECLKKEQ